MIECSLAQECEGERKGSGATNHPCCLGHHFVSGCRLWVGGLGSVCYIWSISPALSGVLWEFKYALSNSLFLSLSQRT